MAQSSHGGLQWLAQRRRLGQRPVTGRGVLAGEQGGDDARKREIRRDGWVGGREEGR